MLLFSAQMVVDFHGEVQVFSFFFVGGVFAVQFTHVKKEILAF